MVKIRYVWNLKSIIGPIVARSEAPTLKNKKPPQKCVGCIASFKDGLHTGPNLYVWVMERSDPGGLGD